MSLVVLHLSVPARLPLAPLDSAHCQHGPLAFSHPSRRCQPQPGLQAAAQQHQMRFNLSLTKCLLSVTVFSAAPQSLLSGYPDQPLRLPPSFLGHDASHGRESVGASLRHVRGDAAGNSQSGSSADENENSRTLVQNCSIIMASNCII